MDEPNGGAAALGGDENADAATDDENGRYTQHCIIFRDFLIPLWVHMGCWSMLLGSSSKNASIEINNPMPSPLLHHRRCRATIISLILPLFLHSVFFKFESKFCSFFDIKPDRFACAVLFFFFSFSLLRPVQTWWVLRFFFFLSNPKSPIVATVNFLNWLCGPRVAFCAQENQCGRCPRSLVGLLKKMATSLNIHSNYSILIRFTRIINRPHTELFCWCVI